MWIKVIMILTLMILVIMSVPVFANTSFPPIPSDVWEYWVIIRDDMGYTKLVASHSPITVTKGVQKLSMTDGEQMYKLTSGTTWEKEYALEGPGFTYFSEMYASNHDVAYDDGSGFFFVRPKISRLTPTMREMDSGRILRNFSVGLIPVLGFLVSAIALRKGWSFLKSQLQG